VTAQPSISTSTVDRNASGRKRWVIVSVAIIALTSVALFIWLDSGLVAARRAMNRQNFKSARSAAQRYLWLHPWDTEARLLAGNAYFQDDFLDPTFAANHAIDHFRSIPDTSPDGSMARLLEGRATFLIRQEPAQSERCFRRSIQLNGDQFESYYLLWQLYNMTERFFDCEPLFREVYRLCPPEQRAFRLREWYSSQFTPLSACNHLDLMMGFRNENEVPSEEVAFRRLTTFHEHEPREPETAAALAQWHIRNQSREAALEVLEAVPDRDQARRSRFFQATYIEALIEAGQTDRAAEEFKLWSGPKEGYQYFRIAGIHSQEIRGQTEEAATLLRQASEIWPGPADWLLLNRLARCLALSGRREESQRVQAEAKRVEGLTDLKIHQKMRDALAHLENPDRLAEVVQFYDLFGRNWEADAWRSIIAELRKPTNSTDEFPAPK
jgi:tetratricopeptide (TPR) repeat protein